VSWLHATVAVAVPLADGSKRFLQLGEAIEEDELLPAYVPEDGLLIPLTEETALAVASEQGAQILLIHAPWPGDGHYRADNPA
jgi:hypothetical protein